MEKKEKGQKNNDAIILDLDSQYKIKYEEYSHFKDSFFRDIYSRMSNAVLEIIEKNESLKPAKEEEQICNIVALLGRRGSGKSSVLTSYCGFLKAVDELEKPSTDSEKGCEGLLNKQEVAFTVLDSIDATLFESGENLLVIILSKLLDKLEQRRTKHVEGDISEQTQALRKLKNEIGRIYEYVKGKRAEEDDEPSIVKLQALSNSWNLRKAFKDLVEKYLQYLRNYYDKDGKKDNYIVIPIDDVDMNVEGCIGILERLRKFLMVPKVIVLLTVNHDQLRTICEQFFYKQIGIYKKDADQEVRLQVQNLTKEYLEKLLPTGRKIMLPDPYGNDGVENRRIEIRGEKLDWRPKFSTTPERYIATVIRFYTGVICDIGINRAYLMKPGSLRKLNNYVREFLRLKAPLTKDEGKFVPEAFEWNMRWLYRDITHRYVEQSDVCIDMELIKGFCKEERGDQFAYLANYLNEMLIREYGKKNKKWPSKMQVVATMCGQNPVSYGDAIYLLHLAETQKLLNRESVYCLKMLISAYLTNLVTNYSVCDEQDRKFWKKKLDHYTKKDLMGYWEEEIFGNYLSEITGQPLEIEPIVISQAGQESNEEKTSSEIGAESEKAPSEVGAESEKTPSEVDAEPENIPAAEKDTNFEGDTKAGQGMVIENGAKQKKSVDPKKWEDTEENIEMVREMVNGYFYTRMFFKPIQKKNEGVRYSGKLKDTLRLRLAEDCIWRVSFGQFIYHIFTYREFSKEIREEIVEQLKETFDFTAEDFAHMDEYNMFNWEQEFYTWEQNTGYGLKNSAVVPFYSVDFMTSLFTCLAEKKVTTKITSSEATKGSLQDLFNAMRFVLAEYDGYYEAEGELAKSFCIDKLQAKFENSPFKKQETFLQKNLNKVMQTLDTKSEGKRANSQSSPELHSNTSADSDSDDTQGKYDSKSFRSDKQSAKFKSSTLKKLGEVVLNYLEKDLLKVAQALDDSLKADERGANSQSSSKFDSNTSADSESDETK